MKHSAFALMLGLILVCGCSEERENKSSSQEIVKTSNDRSAESDSLLVMSLPTPMQIPAILKNYDITYVREVIIPPLQGERPFFIQNVLLGMKLLDLSYVSVFNDGQASINQVKQIKDLSYQLGIASEPSDRLLERFSENIQQQDSLGRIILEFYEGGHAYFSAHGREGVGLLIILGCYLEGMHFTFRHVRSLDLELFNHLIQQQSIYSENLSILLNQYQFPEDIRSTVEGFMEMHLHLKEIADYQATHPRAQQLPENLQEKIKQLELKILLIREELLQEY